ncbi:Fur family transcriptional regulator [Fusobacterium sp. MFO224]|uniref:Fur family transcriptional regulator n=1 Tax=Fusobacterium sp. MFO224 TaxID=3378070 RepID=UPI0038527817
MNSVLNNSNDISLFLKDHGIKPSYQRLKIYSFLLENRIHPTVDTIYKNLCPEIPTLSKTTVYNTLNLFIQKNIIQKLVIEETETRYDVNISIHGHFKCEKCGEVYDIFLEDNLLNSPILKNFKVNETHLYFKGVCEKCIDSIKK